jgi:hypothetical protein
MPYNRKQARVFLTASEVELFESSFAENIRQLGEVQLRRQLKRARMLRDKFRDLLQRQKLATRDRTGSKDGLSGQANKRTAQKAAAFGETLKRFEQHAAKQQAAEQQAIKQQAIKQAAAAKLPRVSEKHASPAQNPAPSRIQPTGPSTRARAVASRFADSNLSHIQGHTSTQVRRSQAKRDHKNKG